MGYVVGISECGTFVSVRMRTGLTLFLATASARDAVALGAKHGLQKLLIDLRGTFSRSSVTDKYDFANRQAEEAGLTREWKIAVLKDQLGEAGDFIETAMRNCGYHCRVFADAGSAAAWLEQDGSG